MIVIDTPEGIHFAKLAALRGAVKLEIRGMRKRGRSACVIAKELLGLKNTTSRAKTLEVLETALHDLRQARLEARRYQTMEENSRYQDACVNGKLDV